jgi:calcium-dependent protein kinase
MISSKVSDSKLKIIDFGLSTKFIPGSKLTELVGTPYYTAPEVINRSYDEKCDVWSCGIVLYIMLSGSPPFSGVTDKEIHANILKGKIVFDGKEWSMISQGAKSLIRKLLETDPCKRLSAKEALVDPWIQKLAPSQQLNPQILTSLKSFNSRSQMRQAIMTFIATQLSSQYERDSLEQSFKSFDENGDGQLTAEELITGYQNAFRMEYVEAKETVKSILGNLDFDGNAVINYSEFLVACFDKQKLLSLERIQQAFKMFDLVSFFSSKFPHYQGSVERRRNHHQG